MPWPRPILRFHRRGAMPNKHLLLAGNACEGRCAHSIRGPQQEWKSR